MIFVTVGTNKYPFKRLVDQIINYAKLHPHTLIYLQSGYSQVPPNQLKNLHVQPFFDYHQTAKLVKQAKYIVGHGGFGTIMQALLAQKTPIIMVRKAKFGEHANDHQYQLTNFLSKQNLILVTDDIAKHLKKTPKKTSTIKPFSFSPQRKKLIKKLTTTFS